MPGGRFGVAGRAALCTRLFLQCRLRGNDGVQGAPQLFSALLMVYRLWLPPPCPIVEPNSASPPTQRHFLSGMRAQAVAFVVMALVGPGACNPAQLSCEDPRLAPGSGSRIMHLTVTENQFTTGLTLRPSKAAYAYGETIRIAIGSGTDEFHGAQFGLQVRGAG